MADWSNCNSTFPNNGGGNTFDATISQGNPTLDDDYHNRVGDDYHPGTWTTSSTGGAALTGDATNPALIVDTGDLWRRLI